MVSDSPGNDGCRDRAQTVEAMGFKMIALVKRFLRDQSGASAVEYGLIAAGILVAIIAVMGGLGAKLNSAFGALN
jgi:pilus assembly protein Flp/PilA